MLTRSFHRCELVYVDNVVNIVLVVIFVDFFSSCICKLNIEKEKEKGKDIYLVEMSRKRCDMPIETMKY